MLAKFFGKWIVHFRMLAYISGKTSIWVGLAGIQMSCSVGMHVVTPWVDLL